jgi:hypothetical protein
MAYTPTLDDLPTAQSYTPSMADIAEVHAQQGISPRAATGSPIDRFLPAPSQGVQNFDQGLQSFFTGVPRGALNTIQNLKNSALGGLVSNYSGLGIPNMIANALSPSTANNNQYANVINQIKNLTDKPINAIKPAGDDSLSGKTGEFVGSFLPLPGGGVASVESSAPGMISRTVQAFQPQKVAENIMDTLSGGKNLEENAQSLAQDIQSAFKARKTEGNALYKPVFDAEGNNAITNENYTSLDKDVVDSYDRKLKNLHQNFVDNPTLQNAHDLQSQLGSSIRQLQTAVSKGTADISTRNALQGYQEAQNAIRNDINDYLTAKNPDLANQYQEATANWLQNVVPYTDNPKLAQIATGEITNPKNINNLFKNPEPEVQKIVDDLGTDAKNKILYSQIGKLNPKLTPDVLAQKLDPAALDTQGLSSYLSPELQGQLNTLKSRINARNTLQRLVGGGSTYLGLSHLGINPEVAASVATGAGIYTPKVVNALSSRINTARLNNAIQDLLKQGSPTAKKIALAEGINVAGSQ